jgi:hypothetical protein
MPPPPAWLQELGPLPHLQVQRHRPQDYLRNLRGQIGRRLRLIPRRTSLRLRTIRCRRRIGFRRVDVYTIFVGVRRIAFFALFFGIGRVGVFVPFNAGGVGAITPFDIGWVAALTFFTAN